MIFKTFNNDIDKISAKWGIFGKSFYDFVDIANKRKIKIDDLITYHGMSLEEAKNEVGSLWSNLFPSKKDLQIDIDSLIPEFNTDSARLALEELQNIQAEINRTKGSWDDYHDKFKDGKEYLLDYAKTNNVLESSVDDVKQANQAARDAAIAHNAALKQQTLSAKAGQVALKGLAIAGNMLAMWAISKALSLVVSGIDKVVNAEKYAEERLNKLKEEGEQAAQAIESLNDKLKSTTSTVNEAGTTYAKLAFVTLTEQILAVEGNAVCDIQVINGDSGIKDIIYTFSGNYTRFQLSFILCQGVVFSGISFSNKYPVGSENDWLMIHNAPFILNYV